MHPSPRSPQKIQALAAEPQTYGASHRPLLCLRLHQDIVLLQILPVQMLSERPLLSSPALPLCRCMQGPGNNDRSMRERVINVATSLPFLAVGFQTRRCVIPHACSCYNRVHPCGNRAACLCQAAGSSQSERFITKGVTFLQLESLALLSDAT